MLSQKPVYSRLARDFVCLRLDWEQGNHFKERFGFILGTGDQMFLSPEGRVITPRALDPNDKLGVLFGRHGQDTTAKVLDQIQDQYAREGDRDALDLEWFLWSTRPSRRPGGFYPASVDAIAGFARLPVATIRGPLPEALEDPEFLRRHVRQFIWTRGEEEGPSRITLRRVADGLPDGEPTHLAELRPGSLTQQELAEALDDAWLTYMKHRPRVAEGYLDNEHGGWMRSVAEIMLFEDREVRRRAREGTLQAPGRSGGPP